jgi:hypothetical protein
MMIRALRKLARIRGGRLVYCASSRPMAAELMWDPLKNACEGLGLEVGRDIDFHETKLKLTFRSTGATYRLVGVDDKGEIDKLRGQPFDEVHVDEAGIYPPELLQRLLYQILMPRIGDRLGAIVMGGTPDHIMRGPFYEFTRPGATDKDGHPLHRPYADRESPEFADWPELGWTSHAWSLDDVVALPDAAAKYPALVNLHRDHLAIKAASRWSDENPTWLREYKGRWAADNTEHVFKFRPHRDGAPWNEWDPLGGERGGTPLHLEKAIAALPKDFKEWRYVYGADLGSADPFALNIFAFAPADPERRIFHVYAFERTGMYARSIAEIVLGPESVSRVLAGKNVEPFDGLYRLTRYPDASVIDADKNHIDELQNVYGVRFTKSEWKRELKFGAIELVNGDLVDGRLKILKGSPLYVQLQELQWQEDSWGNLQENKAQSNHSTDCLVYARKAIATMFETGAVEAPAAASPKPANDLPFMEPDRSARGEFSSLVGDDEDYDDIVAGNGGYF